MQTPTNFGFVSKYEQSILSAVLTDDTTHSKVFDTITPDDFTNPEYAEIYKACLNLHKGNLPINMLAADEIMSLAGCKNTAPIYDVANDPNNVPLSSTNITHYVDKIKKYQARRKLSTYLTRVQSELATISDDDLSSLESNISENVKAITADTMISECPPPIAAAMFAWMRKLEDANNGIVPPGVFSTGLNFLDQWLSCWRNGQYVVLAARPAMGKTTLALQLALNVAQSGKKVVFFSSEMSELSLANRIMGMHGMPDCDKATLNTVGYEQFTLASEVASMDALQNLILIDTMYLAKHNLGTSITTGNIKRVLTAIKKEHGDIGLVVADYIGNIDHEGLPDRVHEVTMVSRRLREYSHLFDTCVLALSQLNRNVDHRTNRVPALSDLRDSGAIEQDADVVIMIYRDEVYNPDTPYPGIAHISVPKNRSGKTFITPCRADFSKYRFEDLPESEKHNYKLTF